MRRMGSSKPMLPWDGGTLMVQGVFVDGSGFSVRHCGAHDEPHGVHDGPDRGRHHAAARRFGHEKAPESIGFQGLFLLCAEGDLNPHPLSRTSTSS